VARWRPDLDDAVERLREEHERIAALLAELEAVLAADDLTPAALLAEVDRLVEELEAHLRYEEEQLVPVLDGVATG
jgi:iron-sulfur cluster repair protein YtfE (RIC family)